MENEYKNLENLIGISFKNREILDTAFTHRSYLNEAESEKIQSNERLEFLGDAILQFLTSEYIYSQYKDFPEGKLTNLRSRLVNTASLATEAAKLDLGTYLSISRGEKDTARESDNILADTFEALVGAIYIDKGISLCKEFVDKYLLYKADEILSAGSLKDSKSLYQELAQEKYDMTPTYKVIKDYGPDHDKHFEVGLYIKNNLISVGKGPSKRKAEQDAAQKALDKESQL